MVQRQNSDLLAPHLPPDSEISSPCPQSRVRTSVTKKSWAGVPHARLYCSAQKAAGAFCTTSPHCEDERRLLLEVIRPDSWLNEEVGRLKPEAKAATRKRMARENMGNGAQEQQQQQEDTDPNKTHSYIGHIARPQLPTHDTSRSTQTRNAEHDFLACRQLSPTFHKKKLHVAYVFNSLAFHLVEHANSSQTPSLQ